MNPSCGPRHQRVVLNSIEKRVEIKIGTPRRAVSDELACPLDSVMLRAPRAKPEAVGMELRFEDRCEGEVNWNDEPYRDFESGSAIHARDDNRLAAHDAAPTADLHDDQGHEPPQPHMVPADRGAETVEYRVGEEEDADEEEDVLEPVLAAGSQLRRGERHPTPRPPRDRA